MAKRSLTDNERKVLFGLVNRPGLNDRELSEALGIKVSTVTAIRRRLRKADYYTTASRRDLEDLRLALHKAGLLDDGTITTTIFPVGMTAIGNFFDYSHVPPLPFALAH